MKRSFYSLLTLALAFSSSVRAVTPSLWADNPSSKKMGVSVTGMVGGFAIHPVAGAAVGYEMSESLRIYGSFFGGGEDLHKYLDDNDPQVEFNKAKVDVRGIEIGARYFVGSSFNISTGIGQRSINLKLSARDRGTADFAAVDTRSDATIWQLAIGNLWRFQNGFQIGADWIGFSVPISHSSSYKLAQSYDSSTTAETERVADEVAEGLAKSTLPTVLQMRMGYVF